MRERLPSVHMPVSDLFEDYMNTRLFMQPQPSLHRLEAYRLFDHEWIQTDDMNKLMPSQTKIRLYAQHSRMVSVQFCSKVVNRKVRQEATPPVGLKMCPQVVKQDNQ